MTKKELQNRVGTVFTVSTWNEKFPHEVVLTCRGGFNFRDLQDLARVLGSEDIEIETEVETHEDYSTVIYWISVENVKVV